MVQDVQTIRDDLAFMRALAQEGRRAPLLSGGALLWAGMIYATASVAAWAVAAQVVAAPQWWQGAVWLVATAVYMPVLFTVVRANKVKPGSTALTNRAVSLGWSAGGWVIFAMFAACFAASWRLQSAAVWTLFPSLVLAVYGAAWMMAAGMSGLRWIKAVAVGCFIAAVAVALLVDRAEIFLAYAAALLLLASVPGWLLMRGEPAEVV